MNCSGTTTAESLLPVIQSIMDHQGGYVGYGPQIFVNGFGRVVATLRHKDRTLAGYGNDIAQALDRLLLELMSVDNSVPANEGESK